MQNQFFGTLKRTAQKLWLVGVFGVLLVLIASGAQAARISNASAMGSRNITWDLGASAGSYGGRSYSELNVGLNWFLEDYMIWRNAVFARFPDQQDSIAGLDTSLRFQQYGTSGDGTFGAGIFGGPGYRFSKTEYSALFVEGGVQLKLGGLSIGGGAKYFSYANPGRDSLGANLPKNDTVFFLILSGGGAF